MCRCLSILQIKLNLNHKREIWLCITSNFNRILELKLSIGNAHYSQANFDILNKNFDFRNVCMCIVLESS